MRPSIFKSRLISLISLFVFMGCGASIVNYDEFSRYNRPQTKLCMVRLPVIIVPGIKGSVLKRGSTELWGKSYRVMFYWKYDELQFKLSPQLEENFESEFIPYYKEKAINTVIMEEYMIDLFGLNLIRVSIYDKLKDFLIKAGGYSPGDDLFTFSYDWRLDNRISSAYLADKISKLQIEYEHFLRDSLGEDQFRECWKMLKKEGLINKENRIKVNIIAHSMGGLISRYYLQVMSGWEHVNKLIMLGTPNLGAMDSLKALAEGELPESVFHFYSKSYTRPIIFSWPSIYQLLPRYPDCLLNPDSDDEYEALEDWGLSESKESSLHLDKALKNWEEYNLIPNLNEEDKKVAEKFLKEQLEDALKFHDAINGDADTNYEIKKLHRIVLFLRKIGEIDSGIIEEIESINENKLNDNAKSRVEDTSTIIFGGNCVPTVKIALLSSKNNNRSYLRFKTPGKGESERKNISMGDGRVPVVSLTSENRKGKYDFHFLICEDHLSLVKNNTFQYNLLRELLAHTNRINPVCGKDGG